MKRYNIQYGVGKCKYVVNYHDGVKKHNDGSDFFDIATFSNYAKFRSFVIKLNLDGFKESKFQKPKDCTFVQSFFLYLIFYI